MDVQHIDVVLMGDPLFRKTGARPIVVHHHDAHQSREYAVRLREIFAVATASLPDEVTTSAEFIRVREKFRRTSSRLFSNRLTRHLYLAVMHRVGLRRHGVVADVLFRRNETRGRGFRPNASGLWHDDVSPV